MGLVGTRGLEDTDLQDGSLQETSGSSLLQSGFKLQETLGQ